MPHKEMANTLTFAMGFSNFSVLLKLVVCIFTLGLEKFP